MPLKTFRLAPDQIHTVASGFGSGLATYHIVVDGKMVGYCYREAARSENDSGWCFFSGDETQEYVENSSNIGLYDVNTIANYDPQIIPLLSSPQGSAFERNSSGVFVAVPFATLGEA